MQVYIGGLMAAFVLAVGLCAPAPAHAQTGGGIVLTPHTYPLPIENEPVEALIKEGHFDSVDKGITSHNFPSRVKNFHIDVAALATTVNEPMTTQQIVKAFARIGVQGASLKDCIAYATALSDIRGMLKKAMSPKEERIIPCLGDAMTKDGEKFSPGVDLTNTPGGVRVDLKLYPWDHLWAPFVSDDPDSEGNELFLVVPSTGEDTAPPDTSPAPPSLRAPPHGQDNGDDNYI